MIIQASWPRSRFEQPVIERELSTLASSLKMEVSFHFKQPHRAQRMALMVTKEPHCLSALLTAVKRRKLKAEPVVIVSNRKDLLPVADEFKIPFIMSLGKQIVSRLNGQHWRFFSETPVILLSWPGL